MYKKKYAKKTYKPRRKYASMQTIARRTVRKALAQNLETKFIVSEFTGAITDTINFNRIATPGIGDAENQRNGDTIVVKSLFINYSFIADDDTNLVRFVVFQWLEDSSLNPPVAASILEGSATIKVQAPFSMNNAQNYRILYDRTHTMSQTGSNNTVLSKKYIIDIPIKKLVFTNNDANAANIKCGQLYLMQVSDSAISGPDITCVCKLNYTDA